MAGLVLCEPTELYNILNQVTKLSRLTEPNYLCLLDVRSKQEYDESHVITARRVKKRANEYLLPESVDLECVKYCVVYDNNTSTLEIALRGEDEEDNTEDGRHELVPGAAVECGRVLAHLTHHPICILKGGYERFSAMYHFLRTQKIIWMPQELDAFQPYPAEIMPGKIYLGNFRQACDPKIQKDLKIKAHVNVSMETGPLSSPPAWLGHPGLFHPGHQSQLCGHLGLPHALEGADLEGRAATILLPVSMISTTLGTSYQWITQYLSFCCLVYFTSHNVPKVNLCCLVCQNFLLFKDRIIFHCVCMAHFVFLFIH
ncbi:serine/threonine/tyrosine-interacting-like protein 1 isoform X5 [Mirounga angustirostris]|uniref:serine/threonine/tyrosine-interacting-like protein 1 isoform X5 n=1 Tax=Mirounga angustirostris TaxID=9716 RepID=UPI00313E12DE